MNTGKIALITGATSGIGEACAEIFAQNGYNLIITGRRKERLEKLEKTLKSTHDIDVLALNFDVREKKEVQNKLNTLTDTWKKIDVLINNAGLAAGLSTIQEGDMDDWETMIDTNIKGILYVSNCIIPYMIENKKGHIINIGSIAGKETYAKGNVYCATKHAVDSLTKSMRIDLLSHGIKVSLVCPGAVETEFSKVRFKGDENKVKETYRGFKPLHAIDVADTIYWICSRPEHVNINDILIMPSAQANTNHTYRV
jgi:3-hydroxy acid dehydrogenase/malonic semialdehyde reductase